MLGVKEFLKRKEKPVEIKHIAVSIKGTVAWAKENKKEVKDVFDKRNTTILSTIKYLVEKDMPIITFYINFENLNPEEDEYNQLMDSLGTLFSSLIDNEMIKENKIKISVIGKWYSLPGMVVESIKEVMEETNMYDKFFVNFCIGYHGQEEIVDSIKLILRDIKEGKIKEEMINKRTIKENISTSYFVPPDVIIETGKGQKYSGILLWDSVNARIVFAKKLFIEMKPEEILELAVN